ncbi:MAG: sigma-70 family RNA polymerase sigma factor [Flavobacteriales bacterium]|nr:sigma-70 family RNA polymerase sigma factor [Flavobacteriales bacterium]
MVNNGLTDEKLVQRAAEGDKKAFEEIYDRYSGRLYNYFYRMLYQDEQLAKDQTQELFLKLVEKASQFHAERSFQTWIFSIANNMCKNIYRHEEVRKRAQNEMAVSLTSESGKTSDELDKRAFKKALKEELDGYDAERKSIFILRFKHHLSIKEIAETTGIAEGTVKSKLFYTLRKLSTQLASFNPK